MDRLRIGGFYGMMKLERMDRTDGSLRSRNDQLERIRSAYVVEKYSKSRQIPLGKLHTSW